MKNTKTQVMGCGACVVSMGENGQMTTSVDVLANGVRSLVSKARRQNASK